MNFFRIFWQPEIGGFRQSLFNPFFPYKLGIFRISGRNISFYIKKWNSYFMQSVLIPLYIIWFCFRNIKFHFRWPEVVDKMGYYDQIWGKRSKIWLKLFKTGRKFLAITRNLTILAILFGKLSISCQESKKKNVFGTLCLQAYQLIRSNL